MPSRRILHAHVAAGLLFAVVAATTGVSHADITFTDIGAGLTGVYYSAMVWGDYDNDGDLDILFTGYTGSVYFSRVYRNDGAGLFSDISAGLKEVWQGSVAWGDYDNDGDLDILLTGLDGVDPIARVYRNDGAGGFIDISAELTGVRSSSVAWGDYDNDGDLDILLTGDSGSGFLSRVYRNDGAGVFTDISAGITGVCYSSVAWGDYDNDGDLDILLTGYTSGFEGISRVYRNDGGAFTDIGAGVSGVSFGSVAWGDYDNDGDLDILLTGDSGSGLISRVYRNDGAGVFTDISAGLTGVCYSSVAWGDYDNNGDLDILLTGRDATPNRFSIVYQNDGGGGFTDTNAALPGVNASSVAWGDFDNDGDLDILLTGYSDSGPISRVYRSDGAPPNTPPEAPPGLSTLVEGDQVTLSWTASTDAETPSAGLTYNLRIGTTPGGSEIMPPMADLGDGYRRVVQLGNAQQRTSWTVTQGPGTSYWSVQAVDGAWAGSEFATERTTGFEEAAEIAGIVDVPNDQGRQVSLSWIRSWYDYVGSCTPIKEYAIFRRIDEVRSFLPDLQARADDRRDSGKDPPKLPLYPPGEWHFVTTVPADAEDSYSTVVPTLADSTIAEGMQYSVFFVRARTDTPGIYFDSEPDSGYSVDNLEPQVPQGLLAELAGEDVLLTWDPNGEEDFDYYAVYRGTEESFDPETPIGYTTTETYTDTEAPVPGDHWYKITATDFSGNESDASDAAGIQLTGVTEAEVLRHSGGRGCLSRHHESLRCHRARGDDPDRSRSGAG